MRFLHVAEAGMVPPEIRQHGEYRTRRLVLEAWDRMEANGEFKVMGM
jgi:hypothetical protein